MILTMNKKFDSKVDFATNMIYYYYYFFLNSRKKEGGKKIKKSRKRFEVEN